MFVSVCMRFSRLCVCEFAFVVVIVCWLRSGAVCGCVWLCDD